MPFSTPSPAFCAPLPLSSLYFRRSTHPSNPPFKRRPRPARHYTTIASLEGGPDPPPDPRKSLFVDEEQVAFWDSLDVKAAFGPLTEEEKQTLREKLPKRLAEFLIRRAEEAVQQRDGLGGKDDDTFLGKFLKDLPPDVVDWEQEEDEFKDYVYESSTGPPVFRRRGSSLFGGGDGMPDVEDVSAKVEIVDGEEVPQKKVWSLFVGNVNSVDEQASKLGYGLVVLVSAFVLFKVLIALVSFFVSFTFSFVAIFALSAGIFVVFFLLKF